MTSPRRLLLTDIGQLTTATGEPGQGEDSLGLITDAVVEVTVDTITRVGHRGESWVTESHSSADEVVSMGHRAVIPGFVDSHTHAIFAGNRLPEFLSRMAGTPYAAGGIRTTVAATRDASDEDLREGLRHRVSRALEQGTTTMEVKTGYGLSVADEERLARIAREVVEDVTFLGAHVVPDEWADQPEGYVGLVCGEMLDAVAPHVRRIDVFLEAGAFTPDQARRILRAGSDRGLIPVLHGGQLGPGEGALIAREFGAASLDHGTYLSDTDLDVLDGSGVVVTLLPITEISTRQPPPDGRRLIERGIPVALASNLNPGSGHSSSMPLVISLAVSLMHFSPADALWSATAGGARALRRSDRGVIAPGARADLIELDADHYGHLAYQPGMPLIRRVWQAGSLVVDSS